MPIGKKNNSQILSGTDVVNIDTKDLKSIMAHDLSIALDIKDFIKNMSLRDYLEHIGGTNGDGIFSQWSSQKFKITNLPYRYGGLASNAGNYIFNTREFISGNDGVGSRVSLRNSLGQIGYGDMGIAIGSDFYGKYK